MGKRSSFERVERDYYPTPLEAVKPLIPHLPDTVFRFSEPCAGDGRLIQHIENLTLGQCVKATDIEPMERSIVKADVFDCVYDQSDLIITNPPWDRSILHPLIPHLSDQAPTWLLFDADWMHTKQSAIFQDRLRKIVSVGRVKWIEGSKNTGKDNCCWYLFDKPSGESTIFVGR